MIKNPQRRAAWRIVAVGGPRRRPTVNPWREAAQVYRDRAMNLAQGLADAHRDLRTMQEAFNAQDDKRPLAGEELDEYVTSLRQRCEVLSMYSVDLERERDEVRQRSERYARDKLAHQAQVLRLHQAIDSALHELDHGEASDLLDGSVGLQRPPARYLDAVRELHQVREDLRKALGEVHP